MLRIDDVTLPFKTSLYIYIFQDEKCRLMRNLSLSMVESDNSVNQPGDPDLLTRVLRNKNLT